MNLRGVWLVKLAFFTLLSAILAGKHSVVHGFDPKAYDIEAGKTATCNVVKRTGTLSRTDTGGVSDSKNALVVEKEDIVPIQLYYIDINPKAKKTILMVHGWPAVWSTWRYQIEAFKDDYRLIVPNLRGFGKSTHPGSVRISGTIQDNVNDMACIIKHAGVDDVICMGHDWGSQICYEMARARPDIANAVIGITIPYAPAGETFTPSTAFVKYFPRLMYQVYFDEMADDAATELDKDVRRSLRSVHRTLASPVPDAFLTKRDSFLTAFGSDEIPPIPYFTPEEEDYAIEQFKIQGFKNTLYFYSTENRYQSWKFVHSQGNRTIYQPVLTLYSSKDSSADWKAIGNFVGSAKYVPNLTTETITADHWPHIENPSEFNRVVGKWLSTLGESEKETKAKPTDEL